MSGSSASHAPLSGVVQWTRHVITARARKAVRIPSHPRFARVLTVLERSWLVGAVEPSGDRA